MSSESRPDCIASPTVAFGREPGERGRTRRRLRAVMCFITRSNGLVAAADQPGGHVADTPKRETASEEEQKTFIIGDLTPPRNA